MADSSADSTEEPGCKDQELFFLNRGIMYAAAVLLFFVKSDPSQKMCIAFVGNLLKNSKNKALASSGYRVAACLVIRRCMASRLDQLQRQTPVVQLPPLPPIFSPASL